MNVNEILLRAEIAGLRAENAMLRAALESRKPGLDFDAAEHERPYWAKPLTGQQYALLAMLVNADGRVLSHEYLGDNLPGYSADRDGDALVKQVVGQVRKKLGDDVILNEFGRGYRADLSKLPRPPID